VGNAVWKRHGRSELTAAEAESLLSDIVALPIEYTPSQGLVSPALSLALRTGRTVYDCLYLALAVSAQTILVTADQRFVNGLTETPFAASVRWLGEH
jgi:predicted nucleic acid-binding protein